MRQPFSEEGRTATEEELWESSMVGKGRAIAKEELRMASMADVPMEDA